MNNKTVFKAITASALTLALGLGTLLNNQPQEQIQTNATTVVQDSAKKITMVASSKAVKTTGKYKTTDALNMRTGASTSHKKIMTLKKGAVVTTTYKKKVSGTTWYKVKYNGKTGWVTGTYLKTYKKSSATAVKATKISGKYKTTAILNMRTGASTSSKKVTTLKKGAVVTATYKKKVSGTTWYKVKYSGKTGWVSSSYLKKYKKTTTVSNSNLASRNKIISAGSQYLGVPYVWGGMSPSGFDCSGFTAYAYKKAGYGTLPHNSRSQRAVTKEVNSPQVGDLIFFTASPGGSTITHVGLYAGNNKVLHAAGTSVQYQSVEKGSYWEPRIVGYGALK
ncbi:C40 family peptidase [Viridibacillus sp. YIM B01967]|uniref:C40 family peptidase n=1 Tax=Viridibacillus soli TaxID=2798301 RepID=A0ABS1H979_9BACL|nr:C40 family peptidase [Viridibacillus soli]MBK3495854.1 C40 family peptidase [Viridibacillus soli]